MEASMANVTEQAALLALVNHTNNEWYKTASLIEEVGSALALLDDALPALDETDAQVVAALRHQVTSDEVERYATQIHTWTSSGLRLVTVLDDDYPLNLREVYNRPPFLFLRGELRPEDNRSLAVVGTRTPTPQGLEQTRQLARDLAGQGVTVLSGLARGIDSAAHEGALEAGGRTVAVFGTGINRIYPPENASLAARILDHGAHVSQFWPDAPPTKFSFPMRNVVSSGMALGTVVVEAHGRSGARMQARLCLEHGKRLFLVRSLVLHEEWAQRYAERPGAMVVESVDDVVDLLDELLSPPMQLSLYQ
jgi:DNA processing protein